jgi:transcription elongation factor SPT5
LGVVKVVDERNKQVSLSLSATAGLDGTYEFDISDLTKHFDIGKHVKVIGGHYSGETGTVVKVYDGADLSGPSSVGSSDNSSSGSGASGKSEAVLILDLTSEEITVFTDDLRISDEVAKGSGSLGGYKMFDLVAMKDQMRGIIVRVGREKLSILLQGGAVQQVVPSDLQYGNRNMESKRSITLDARKQAVSVNDAVKVLDGPFKGYKGKVKHISRHFVFIHSNQHGQDSGMIVVSGRQIALAGSRNKQSLADLSMGKINDSTTKAVRVNRGGKRRSTDVMQLIASTVQIQDGIYRHHVGMVSCFLNLHLFILCFHASF